MHVLTPFKWHRERLQAICGADMTKQIFEPPAATASADPPASNPVALQPEALQPRVLQLHGLSALKKAVQPRPSTLSAFPLTDDASDASQSQKSPVGASANSAIQQSAVNRDESAASPPAQITVTGPPVVANPQLGGPAAKRRRFTAEPEPANVESAAMYETAPAATAVQTLAQKSSVMGGPAGGAVKAQEASEGFTEPSAEERQAQRRRYALTVSPTCGVPP